MAPTEILTALGLYAWSRIRTWVKLGVDTHERAGVLPVVGAAQVLAKSTAGIDPAGDAEKAATAKSEALAPCTQGETGCEVVTLREGKRKADEPPPEALSRQCEYKRTRMGEKRKTQLEPPLQEGAQTQGNATRCRKGTRMRVNASTTG